MFLTIFFLLASGQEYQFTFPADAEFGGIKPESRCYEAAQVMALSGLLDRAKVPAGAPFRCTETHLM
jgi:hypothetical protein